MRLFIYLLCYLFISCIGNSKSTGVKQLKHQNIKDSIINIEVKEISQHKSIFDTLLLSNVKFNNHNLKIKYPELANKRPDSIVSALSISNSSWECGNPFDWDQDSLKIIYLNRQEYISNKKIAHLYYAKFEGSNELFIENKDTKLTKKTTIDDFKKNFKNVQIQKVESGYAVYNITFNPEQVEDNWMFYFNEHGLLVELYLDWWLC